MPEQDGPQFVLAREFAREIELREQADVALEKAIGTLTTEVTTLKGEVKDLKTNLGDLADQVRKGVRALTFIAATLLAWFVKANPGMAAAIFDTVLKRIGAAS